jgi:hypothetical protein
MLALKYPASTLTPHQTLADWSNAHAGGTVLVFLGVDMLTCHILDPSHNSHDAGSAGFLFPVLKV